ncbi:MAG: PKD domain-containing protein [Bdellovibrionales bacterium]
MENMTCLKKVFLIAALASLTLQGCSKDASVSSIESTSISVEPSPDECIEAKSSILGSSILKSLVESVFSTSKNPCKSSHTTFWDANDGSGYRSDEISHAYRNPGEYALEATVINSDGSIEKSVKHVVVDSCEAGESCKALQSPRIVSINEDASISLLDASSDEPASSSIRVIDSSGNEIPLNKESFSSNTPGDFTIIIENDGRTHSREISIVDISDISNDCNLSDLILSGPSSLKVNEEAFVSIHIPSCIKEKLSSIKWSVSNRSEKTFEESTIIKFDEEGKQSYSVELNIQSLEDSIHLSRDVLVDQEICSDCPTIADIQAENNISRTPSSEEDITTDEVIDDFIDTPITDDNKSCGSIAHGQEAIIGTILSSEIISCDSSGNKLVTSSTDEIKICNNGVFEESDTPASTIVFEGPCYQWVKTGSTQCTQACGGTQKDIFSCQENDQPQNIGDAQVCGALRSDEYTCDGDPNFEEIKITEVLEKGEPTVCHSNKTGYIVDKEITQEVFNCVDHAITLTNTIVTVEEAPFCMDLKRCNDDSLSPSRAHGRLKWMKMCASEQPKVQEFFDVTENFDRAPQNSYKVSEDGSTIIGRPTYVTFRSSEGKVWRAPAPGTKNWKTRSTSYSIVDETISCEVPADAEIAGICLSSCVTPSQIISSGNGSALPISSAYINNMSDVMTLSPLSTILKPVLMSTPVQQFITEVADSEHDIMIFTLASGNKIEYTPNHPVLTADGKLKEAGDFIIGQSFVKKSGALDEIVKIENIKFFGKVYNVYMKNTNPENNIVVVNDYLTGSARFQNEDHDFVDRSVLRNALTK